MNDSVMALQMTNEVGKAMFSKAGELGVPVGIMCMKVLLILLVKYNVVLQMLYCL